MSNKKPFLQRLVDFIVGPDKFDAVGHLESWMNAQTGYGLTGAQQQQNEFNSAEAAAARDWSAQMDNTKYQRTVADMKAAGVNPALAMSNGAASPPSASSATSGSSNSVMSMSDLMSLMLAKKQGKLLDAQAANARAQGDAALQNANTNSRNADTAAERLRTVEQPLSNSQIAIGRSVITLNSKSVDKMDKEIAQLDEDIKLTQLHELATSLDIVWKGETWEDNKRLLVAQVGKTIAASALDYALRGKAISEKELNELQKDINQKDKFINDAIVDFLKQQPGTGWIQNEINKGSNWYSLLHGYGVGILDAADPSELSDLLGTTSVSDRVVRGFVRLKAAKNMP